MDFCNVQRDPGERYEAFYAGLFSATPMHNLPKRHMVLIRRYPHRVSKTMPEGAELTPHD